MIRNVLRAFGWLVVLGAATASTLFVLSSRRLSDTVDVSPHRLVLEANEASVENGQRLVELLGCQGCHGTDLGGRRMDVSPLFAVLDAPNLTAGPGGIGRVYTVGDYERAIRHGVRPDGSPLFRMPSDRYAGLADSDVADIVSYLKSVPPIDFRAVEREIGPTGRLAVLFDGEALPASGIDHDAPHLRAVAAEPTPGYGAYLAATCRGCHAGRLVDERPLSAGALIAANPAPHASGVPQMDRADFARLLQEGTRPDGFAYRSLTPVQVDALWSYLQGDSTILTPRP